MYRILGADGNEYGPVPAEVLHRWVAEGRANDQSKVLIEGTTEWRPLREVPELAGTLTSPVIPKIVSGPIAPGPIAAPQPRPRTNPLALTGMVLGIFSLTVCLCCYGLPFNVAGLVCSLMGLTQIQSDPSREQGKGLAIAGLVLSLLSLLLGLAVLLSLRTFGSGELLRRIQRL